MTKIKLEKYINKELEDKTTQRVLLNVKRKRKIK